MYEPINVPRHGEPPHRRTQVKLLEPRKGVQRAGEGEGIKHVADRDGRKLLPHLCGIQCVWEWGVVYRNKFFIEGKTNHMYITYVSAENGMYSVISVLYAPNTI